MWMQFLRVIFHIFTYFHVLNGTFFIKNSNFFTYFHFLLSTFLIKRGRRLNYSSEFCLKNRLSSDHQSWGRFYKAPKHWPTSSPRQKAQWPLQVIIQRSIASNDSKLGLFVVGVSSVHFIHVKLLQVLELILLHNEWFENRLRRLDEDSCYYGSCPNSSVPLRLSHPFRLRWLLHQQRKAITLRLKDTSSIMQRRSEKDCSAIRSLLSLFLSSRLMGATTTWAMCGSRRDSSGRRNRFWQSWPRLRTQKRKGCSCVQIRLPVNASMLPVSVARRPSQNPLRTKCSCLSPHTASGGRWKKCTSNWRPS